jgi:hypothetical protein
LEVVLDKGQAVIGESARPLPMNAASTSFPETPWSLVLRARWPEEASRANGALDELRRQYWFPLYAFARRAGHEPPVAEDLAQGFFALLLSRRLLEKADPDRGRLRSFLIGAFKLHISDETRREQRMRRGGGQPLVSLDQVQAEEWYVAGDRDQATPEERYDRDRAEAAVEHAMLALAEECAERGKSALLSWLREFLSWDQAEPEVAAAARDLGLTEGALRVAVHRPRVSASSKSTTSNEHARAGRLAYLNSHLRRNALARRSR